ncbi:MAG: hypothetical protein ASARMPREDX12_000700 [Alectoria sarmentosa]|nr:MAG: hypothetical protein ASARMPREDX12_000700 [Alectoria sarmentosa]
MKTRSAVLSKFPTVFYVDSVLSSMAYQDRTFEANSPDGRKKGPVTAQPTCLVDPSPPAAENFAHWRWALFQKRKLEEVLADFKVWNAMLKDLVSITLAAGRTGNRRSVSLFGDRASEEDIRRLGVGVHTQLRKLNTYEHTDDTDVHLRDISLETPATTQLSPLSFGVLSTDESVRENVLIEYKPIAHQHKPVVGAKAKQSLAPSRKNTEAVRLASLLRLAGKSELRTLPFVGYIEKTLVEPPQYAFIFRYPERALEQSPDPYLVNFEYSRAADQNTTWTWDQDAEKNMYRHPERQGLLTRSFDKTYDIYALGVVLLEIGLWQTAFAIRQHAKQAQEPAVRFDRYDLKEAFIALAKQRLSRTMGLAYRDAVLTCLMGDFTCKVHDDGFGMEFYEKVVQRLDVKRLLLSAKTTA